MMTGKVHKSMHSRVKDALTQRVIQGSTKQRCPLETAGLGFQDNRSVAVSQRRLKESINNRPHQAALIIQRFDFAGAPVRQPKVKQTIVQSASLLPHPNQELEPETLRTDECQIQASAELGRDIAIQDPTMKNRLQAPGAGQPVPANVRRSVEHSLGTDLSNVRVLDNPQDRVDAARIGAKAFAYGNHIWLGPGASISDKNLMAHELTHVVQQGATEKNSGTGRRIQPQIQRIPGWVLRKLAGWAHQIPGYYLLSLTAGRDPISGKAYRRTGQNILRAVIGLIPGGEAIYQNLKKSGAADQAATWLDGEIAKLGLNWSYVKGLFKSAWNLVSWTDAVRPWNAWLKIKGVFSPPLGRLLSFAGAVGNQLMVKAIEAPLLLAGPFGKKVMDVLRSAGKMFMSIVRNPIGFLGHLVMALKSAFGTFSASIGTYLGSAFFSWLFASMNNSGLQMPKKLNTKGILMMMLQTLGITYSAIRKRLVQELKSEKMVERLEKSVNFLIDFASRGVVAISEQISQFVGNVTTMLVDAIKKWVMEKVVMAAILKLITMLNPAGALVQAIMSIYNIIMVFLDNLPRIVEMATAVFTSVSKIAAGQVGEASKFILKAMIRSLGMLVSFFVNFLGLGKLAKIVVGKIRDFGNWIQEGIAKLVKGIVRKVRSMFRKSAVPCRGKTSDGTKGKKVSPRQHRALAIEIADKLKTPPPKGNPSEAIRQKQNQAKKLREQYQRYLTKDHRLNIDVDDSIHRFQEDRDIDFTIRIRSEEVVYPDAAKAEHPDIKRYVIEFLKKNIGQFQKSVPRGLLSVGFRGSVSTGKKKEKHPFNPKDFDVDVFIVITESIAREKYGKKYKRSKARNVGGQIKELLEDMDTHLVSGEGIKLKEASSCIAYIPSERDKFSRGATIVFSNPDESE